MIRNRRHGGQGPNISSPARGNRSTTTGIGRRWRINSNCVNRFPAIYFNMTWGNCGAKNIGIVSEHSQKHQPSSSISQQDPSLTLGYFATVDWNDCDWNDSPRLLDDAGSFPLDVLCWFPALGSARTTMRRDGRVPYHLGPRMQSSGVWDYVRC